MRRVLNLTVLIAALGYFVDMFDITVFGVVRIPSLKALGVVDPGQLMQTGMLLLNLQACGMLVGGLLWGVIGDKKGRLSVLFGSIFIYSVANILNAFVTSVPSYAVLRFCAGVGLAGELGAAVTLVSELLSKEDRGYGTAIIAALGLLGAVTASLVGQLASWKVAYLLGGTMGVGLLLARFKMADSEMFQKSAAGARRGDLRLLFSAERFRRYLFCILVGIPIYFTTGILFSFAPELAREMGLTGVTAGNALLFGSIGLTIGDLLSGLLSQWLKSRRKAVLFSFFVGFVFATLYFRSGTASVVQFYAICGGLGLAAGYWAVLVTIAAEQFGTNLRATVATSVPNFVRSSVIILTLTFTAFRTQVGFLNLAIGLGMTVFAIALFSLSRLRETYGRDLDFSEIDEPLRHQVSIKDLPLLEPNGAGVLISPHPTE